MAEKRESLATQKFVEVAGVKQGTAILKNGALRQILMVSAMNFDLKSDEEQGLVIDLFQGFLNSLNFSVQILIHSRKLNIDRYLAMLSDRMNAEENELLKNQIEEYREFVRALVAENAIMNKTYFVVVPFDPINVPGIGSASGGGILGFFKKKQGPAANETPQDDKAFEHNVEQLNQRTAHVTTGIEHIGLRVVALNDEELIELFYNLYNPGGVEKKELAILKGEQPPPSS